LARHGWAVSSDFCADAGVIVTAVTANHLQISKVIRAKAVSSKAGSLSHEKVELDRKCDRGAASRYPNFCGVYG
jgi:hypothetical protein